MTPLHVFENEAADPAKRLRLRWGQSLDEHMRIAGVTRKQLQRALEAEGHEVSLQAIGYWINGDTSPRPLLQGAIATVLKVPVRSLFPIDTAA